MTKQSLSVYADTAKLRSNVYNFLNLIYAKEPDPELINTIMTPDFLNILSEIGTEFGDEVLKTPKEKLMEDLSVEYTRLFLGPGPHISPHESVYVGGYRDKDPKVGLLWGNATVEVKDMVEDFGYGYRDEYNGIPDHLAVELEIMVNLTAREHDMLTNKNVQEGYQCLLQEKKFLTEHLSRWIAEFCGLVIENADHVFYRELASLTRDYVLNDMEVIDQHISEIKDEQYV